MNSATIPDNDINTNYKLYLLDPISVIIKLAILGNKPIGTKLLIQNNVVYFQEPGFFQSITRFYYSTNKTDLQYMYNPIYIACLTFLSKESVAKTPRLKNLFINALAGLKNLIETYKSCSILTLCLNYYYAIIKNYIENTQNDYLFYKDGLTSLYTKELTDNLNNQWSQEKIKVVLDLISFLTNDEMAANNVKSLETIMENNDKNSLKILNN
jgi:hypothetical protein